MFAEYIKDRFPRRGCGHILGLFKQLIQEYVRTPEPDFAQSLSTKNYSVYLSLSKDNFVVHNFRCQTSYVIHLPDPDHLIVRF